MFGASKENRKAESGGNYWSIGETNLISLKMSYGSGAVTCKAVASVIKDELNEKYIISSLCEREIIFIVILTLLLVYIETL